MDPQAVEQIELTLLLEGIYQRWGYDFRGYSRASLRRRVGEFMVRQGITRIGELTARVLHDEPLFQGLVQQFSVPVTEMFRDPTVYLALRREVVPYLRTYPFIKVWHAGCATGEEVYSLAILLEEEGLYDRCTIYATDLNEAALDRARAGVYPVASVQEFTENYQRAGGLRSFGEWYQAGYDRVVLPASLRRNVTFARHNLATDHVFSEVHLVLCRNVLIYFDRALQDRAIGLFEESLVHDGFLCLGSKETLAFSARRDAFSELDPACRIYRRRPC
jgi:chemotaxis protein methyltransferase CheR